MRLTGNGTRSNMNLFTVIWFGQLISTMGSTMTKFALMIWAYEKIAKASVPAFLGFSSVTAFVLMSPLAGAIVDRLNRKFLLMICNLLSCTVTVILLVLYCTHVLQIWHLFIAEGVLGGVGAFQTPAFSAAVTLMVPKEKYSQASGMRSFSDCVSQILAPVLGGFIVSQFGVKYILIIDIITFATAAFTLVSISLPNPTEKHMEHTVRNGIAMEIRLGVRYILKRRGLLYLILVFLGMNILSSVCYYGILPAMILAKSHNNKMTLAYVQGALGVGGVVGSLVVSTFSVPGKKIITIMLSGTLSFFCGDIFLSLGRHSIIWIISAFLAAFFIPFMVGADNAIWQSKVHPGLQGRVFSIKNMLQNGCSPLGYLLGGILADYIFEPGMAKGGVLTGIFGFLTGTGKGSGMALMFLCTGILGTLLCISGFFIKDLRSLEKNIPDFDI